MIKKIKIQDHEQWLAERRNSIGGSEIGAILGLNNYTSPYAVWARKTGLIPEADQNEAMRQGTDLEQYVADRFVERSGLKVQKCNYLLRNPDYPHLHATIDRKIVGRNAGLECKTASAYNRENFTDDSFPLSYYAQCVAYMAVCGYAEYFLAALVLGSGPFKIYHMTTQADAEKPDFADYSMYISPAEFDGIRDAAIDFWQYVEAGTAPPVDGTAATTSAIKTIYADADESLTEVDLFGLDAHFDMINDIKSQIDQLKQEQTAEENAIKAALGDAIGGKTERFFATWKPQTRRTFDVKAFNKAHPEMDLSDYYKQSTTRVFKFKEVK